MRNILLLTGVILCLAILYVGYSVYYLNKEEVYYGQVSDNRKINKMVSEDMDSEYGYRLSEEDNFIKKGDWVKMTFTENKGTIINREVIREQDVPTDVKNKIESNNDTKH